MMGDHYQALRESFRSGLVWLLARTHRTPSRPGPTTNRSSGLTCERPLGLDTCSAPVLAVGVPMEAVVLTVLTLLAPPCGIARDTVSICMHSRGRSAAARTDVLCPRFKMGPLCLLHLLTLLMRTRSCSGTIWVLHFSMWSCACCVLMLSRCLLVFMS